MDSVEARWPTRSGALALWLVSQGCIASQLQMKEPARPSERVTSVLVVPLSNHSDAPTAGRDLSQALAAELHALQSARVVEIGEAVEASIDRSRAVELGRQLRVEGVLYGVLLEYESLPASPYQRGRVPSIVADLRLVSTRSGELLWAATYETQQDQLWTYAEMPIARLVASAARELAEGLSPHLAKGAAVDARPPVDAAHPAVIEHLETPPAAAQGASSVEPPR